MGSLQSLENNMSLPLNPSETFLGNILKKIHNALDFTAILQVIVEQTQGFLQIDRVKIYQFAEDGSGCVITEALHGQTLPSLLGLHFPSTDIPPGHRESLQRDRPIVSIDVTSRRKSFHYPKEREGMTSSSPNLQFGEVDPCHLQYLLAMGVLASLSVPILFQDKLWGLIAIHHSHPRRFSESEIDILELLSKEVTLAISQESLASQVRSQVYQEEVLRQLDGLLQNTRLAKEGWQRVLATCLEVFESEAGLLYLAPDLTGEPSQCYDLGFSQPLTPLIEHPFWQSLMKGTLGKSVRLWESFEDSHPQSRWDKPLADYSDLGLYSLEALATDPDGQAIAPYFEEAGLQALLVLPLRSQEQWVGCLILGRREQEFTKRWAGHHDPDIRNQRPRDSFVAWIETQRRVPPWTKAQLNLAKAIGAQLYMNVTQQFLTRLIHHQTAYDPLTQLPNWVIFNQRLTLALLDALYQGEILAVLVIALDRFKRINEGLGHGVGDFLLQQVASRLQTQLEEFEGTKPLLSRWHGDGFTVLSTHLNYVDEVVNLCQGVLGSFRDPFYVQGQVIYLTASVGISLAPYDGETPETLLKHAETALTQAKQQGKNNYQFYRPQSAGGKLDRLSLEADLRRALERNELLIYYQPQLDLISGQLSGVEALLRWQHPHLGLVSPADFIPLAEETGLIVEVGYWVLRMACQQYQQWQPQGNVDFRLAINLSARQFQQPDLLAQIFQILEETGMPPHRLEFEITESLMMQDIEGTIPVLHQLKEAGIKIAVDDFGTGYSSLAVLRNLPIHVLKIDKSFLKDFLEKSQDAAIIQCIIALSRGLNLKVVAEGIETQEQLTRLRAMNCDYGQGFYISCPVPANAIAPLVFSPQLIRFQEETVHHLVSFTPSHRASRRFSSPLPLLEESLPERTELSQKILEYAALQEELKQRSLREKMILQITQKLRLSLNINDILHTTANEIRHFLDTDRVVLYQFDEKWSGKIAVESRSQNCQPIINEVIYDPCFKENYVKLYRQGRVRAIEDIHQANLSQCHQDLLAHYQVKANLVVPIMFQDKLWGLMIAHHCCRTRKWLDHELQLLAELSNQVAIAIHQGELYRQLENANLQLQLLSSQDALTKVGNRHLFDNYLQKEWQRLQRSQGELSLLLCDIDFFKQFNDHYGHPSGDNCLQEVAQVLSFALKQPADLVARYGGEEFAVVLPNTDLEGAIYLAETIRENVKSLEIPHSQSPLGLVTLSIGVAHVIPSPKSSPEALIVAADQALYQAKAKGRDHVCFDGHY